MKWILLIAVSAVVVALVGCSSGKLPDAYDLKYRFHTNIIQGQVTSVGKTVDTKEVVALLGYYDKSGYYHVITGFKTGAMPGYEALLNGRGK